jgi:ubiquilin
MPVAFITVKLPDGSLVHLDVDLKTRVEEFRTILAPKSGIKRHKQRLVFAGRLLQDGRSLEAYGIERNSTIHLLHGQTAGGDGPEGLDITAIPPQLGALQRHVLQNPDILQQMLESPAMQSLLNDHDFMRSLLKMDPRLSKMLESSPELASMLSDVDFMRQATEALRNPVHVRDVLRSTDRSMTALEELPGGAFDVLRSMVQDIKRPTQDEEFSKSQAPTQSKKAKDIAAAKDMLGENEDEDNEDGEKEGADGAAAEPAEEGVPAPEWLGTFDTNAMASMMQDQNMQHLLSQLVQTMPGPTVKPHPDDPFLDSGFIGQMMHAQTIMSMASLQDAVAKLSMTGEPGGPGGGGEKPAKSKKASSKATADETPAQDSPAVLSGLNAKSPAADFKSSFNLFLAAEQESPEVRYKGQLQAMQNMGFNDKEACIQALHEHDGNMTKAVESMMAQKQN